MEFYILFRLTALSSKKVMFNVNYLLLLSYVHRLFCCRSKVRNLYLHGGLLLTSPYDEFVSNSGGIPPSTQPHHTSINNEQTPLLHSQGSRQTELQNPTENTIL